MTKIRRSLHKEAEEVVGGFLLIQLLFQNQRSVGVIVIIQPSITQFPKTAMIKVTTILIIKFTNSDDDTQVRQGAKVNCITLPESWKLKPIKYNLHSSLNIIKLNTNRIKIQARE